MKAMSLFTSCHGEDMYEFKTYYTSFLYKKISLSVSRRRHSRKVLPVSMQLDEDNKKTMTLMFEPKSLD